MLPIAEAQKSMPVEPPAVATFRFYEELNDFLAPARRKRTFEHRFTGTPSVKDVIEALGVPHTEVDLVLVDGESVDFRRRLVGGERVAVYPVFERFDIAPLTRLRPRPLRESRFVLDVHLGRLARYLRLAGFDTLYRTDYDDHTIVALAVAESRVVLTRDKGLLKHAAVTRGHWLRATDPREQIVEVLCAFDLAGSLRPFTRCMRCNTVLRSVAKADVAARVPPRVRAQFDAFAQCPGCARLYWRGSHYDRMCRLLDAVQARLASPVASAADGTPA
jgi:hypothetical protein